MVTETLSPETTEHNGYHSNRNNIMSWLGMGVLVTGTLSPETMEQMVTIVTSNNECKLKYNGCYGDATLNIMG